MEFGRVRLHSWRKMPGRFLFFQLAEFKVSLGVCVCVNQCDTESVNGTNACVVVV